MKESFLASNAKRATWKKVCAGAIALSLNLSLGGVGGLLLIPQVASAAAVYSISGSSSLTGTVLDVSGTSFATNETGADSNQHMAVDWDTDQDHNPQAGISQWQVANVSDFTWSPTFSGGAGGGFTASWSGSHDFSSNAGTSTVRVMVYHGNTSGHDGSASIDTLVFVVVIPPPTAVSVTISSPGTTGSSGSISYTVTGATTISCTLDGNPVSCDFAGPYAFSGLSSGSYTFALHATGPGGVADATATWTVDASGPVVTIITKPSDPSASSGATFTFSSNETPATFVCTLDAAASSCTSGVSYTGLLDGPHTFSVVGTDQYGNSGTTASYTWTIDTIAPTIAPHADVTAEATSGSGRTVIYTSPATTDNIDAPGVATCTPVSGSLFAIGSTLVTCNATDAAGNSATPTTFNVVVDGNDAPVITLNGLNPMSLILGLDTYSEPGATANDEEDGLGLIVTNITGAVNSFVIGAYYVAYNFIDSGSLAATEVVRTVNVVAGATACSDGVTNDNDLFVDYPSDIGCSSYGDTNENESPVITVTGENPLEIVVNVGSYSEQGATADDAEDGTGLTVTNINASAVNTGVVDTYSVYYNYTDTDGASATQAIRTVNVVYGNNECNDGEDNDGDGDMDGADSGCSSVGDTSENTPPTVVVETEMLMLTLHSAFNPPVDVTATDVEDGSVAVEVIDNPVDVDTIGDYTVTYGATDSDGAGAEPQTQTVKVRAECADGIDNDDDGKTDAADSACHSDGNSGNEESYDPALGNESNDPECDDGIDNDGDETFDAEDSGCSSSSDNSENTPPVIETEMLAMNLTVGDPFVMPDYTASDDEDGDLTEVVDVGGDEVDTNTPGVYEVTLDVIDNDDTSADTVTITVTVAAAPVDVCPSDEGVQTSTEDCTPPPPTPVCADGIDNDGDGLVDMSDPGCGSTEDNDETNAVTPPPSGGGGGGGGGGGSGFPVPIIISVPLPVAAPAAAPQGEVLGAATEELPLPAGCTAYIDTYLKKGRKNNAEKVKLLQTFLNEEMNAGLPITGFFGSMTHASVMKFQVKHKKDILQPWIDAGFGGMDFGNKGTGYVYKTTKRAINMMKCAEIVEPMPELVPDTNI